MSLLDTVGSVASTFTNSSIDSLANGTVDYILNNTFSSLFNRTYNRNGTEGAVVETIINLIKVLHNFGPHFLTQQLLSDPMYENLKS